MFQLNNQGIDPAKLRETLQDPRAGGYAVFEGWVRNKNEGHDVTKLEYEAYGVLALKEGQKIMEEAMEKFDIVAAKCEHATGLLQLGDIAVWIGVTAEHRADAFNACQYIINEIKVRVPVWKKEYYVNGDSGWVNCAQCAQHVHN